MPSRPVTSPTEHCDVSHRGSTTLERLHASLVSPSAAAELAETFKVLGDVTCVRISDALSQEELCVCDVASLLELSESAVSHQLRLLRSLRLVRARRVGRLVFYTLDDQHILRLFHQARGHVQEGVPAPVVAGADG